MSPRHRHLSDESNDTWRQYAPVIRQLYVTERKTLKEVKRIMESEHQFPKIPLSTYETKLRDHLGLRKKLKKNDWLILYQHWLERGERPTAVYLDGAKIRAPWKEIRRSGARLDRRVHNCPLPAGVAIRTPSPQPCSTSRAASFFAPFEKTHLAGSGVLTSTSSGCRALPMENHLSETQIILRRQRERVLWLCLGTLPWFRLLDYLRTFVDDPLAVRRVRTTEGDVVVAGIATGFTEYFSNSDPATIYKTSFPSVFAQEFREQWKFNTVLLSNFDAYDVLAKAMYCLSNYDAGVADKRMLMGLFQLLFQRLPGTLLRRLLKSGIPSIRAVWQALVHCSWAVGHKDAFCLLMSAGFQHHAWTRPQGHMYLSFAAGLRCTQIILDLLETGVRADDELHGHEAVSGLERPSPAILEAVGIGDLGIVKLLMRDCNVNRKMFECHSNFETFFKMLRPKDMSDSGPSLSRERLKLDLEDPLHRQVLEMFLQAGADVDSPCEPEGYDLQHFYDSNGVPC